MLYRPSTFSTGLFRFFILTTAIVAVLLGTLCAFTPLGADDLLFLGDLNLDGSLGYKWDKFVEACRLRWTTEPGRLGVLSSIAFLYFLPKWAFGIILAISFFILVRFCCRVTDVECGSILSWFVLAAIIFIEPWYDFMFHISYAMNYVVGGALAVASAYYFFNIEKIYGWQLIGIYLLMYLTGWIHEAYSVPFGIAATIWILRRYKSISLRTIFAWLFLVAGICTIALSPTLWRRAQWDMLIPKLPIIEAIMQLGPALFLVIVFLIISRIAFHLRRIRKNTIKKDIWIFYFIFIIVSLGILIKFYSGPRTGYPIILFSIVGIAFLLRQFIVSSNRRLATTLWGTLISLLCIGHLGYACYKEYQLRSEYNDIVDLYKASKDGTFYYDLTYPKLDATLYKTSVRDFHSRIPMWMWERYYDGNKHLVILPTAMKGFSKASAKNSSRTKNALIYNGWIVFPASYDLSGVVKLTIYTKDGRKMLSRYRVDEFKDESGESYKLIVPHVKVLDQSLEITDVELF